MCQRTLTNKIESLNDSLSKYNAYDSQTWKKEYFDKFSGGFNVYHKDHQFTSTGGGGEAEKTVGKMLAKMGKQVEFLPEIGFKKSPDINFDEQTWDIKYIDKANEHTIRDYISNARKANNAIFYWDKNDKFDSLCSAVDRSIGYFKSKNALVTMPDIYYINKRGILTNLLKK
jgi:hypothetical protein